jgi:hopene-associated glycosyltransferase HpnB
MSTLAWVAAIAWAWMLVLRGRFWLIEAQPGAPAPVSWPAVTAVVPARNEADVIGGTVTSLLTQNYPGPLRVVLTDDESSDGTADRARQAAQEAGAPDRLLIVPAAPLPPGWSGKLWAQAQGVDAAEKAFPDTDLFLLSDADIAHAPDQLQRMTARLLHEGSDMASLMVRLSTESLAEKLVIPAFVFFFRLLYPFSWVADPLKRTAAAAGGYMLIRRPMLAQIGGFATMKDALIDDCTLAGLVKRAGGRITLDLARDTVSTRIYTGWSGLWMMIARSAYTQLRCSPLLLIGTVLAMTIAFLLPPVVALAGGAGSGAAWLAWLEMTLAFAPMVHFYRLSLLWSPLLPVAALFYMGATIDSARRHWTGRGGEWKGRIQAAEPRSK